MAFLRAGNMLAVLTFLGLLGLASAIRANDDIEPQESTCTEDLRPLVRGLTAKEVYRPVLKGTYRLRSKLNGRFLTAIEDSAALAMSLHEVESSRLSDWKVKRVESSASQGVQYTFKNRKIGSDVLGQDTLILDLHGDGIHFKVKTEDQRFLQSSVTEPFLSDEESDEVWSLEWVNRCFLNCFRTRDREYKRQWDAVETLPLWYGSDLRWKDVCGETNQECSEYYNKRRREFVSDVRIEEDKRYMVMQSTVLSSCDLPIALMTGLAQVGSVLTEAGKVSETCSAQSYKDRQASFLKALEVECFDACYNVVKDLVEGGPLSTASTKQIGSCDVSAERDMNSFFTEVLKHDECISMRYDSLEKVWEHVMMKKCWTWSPPTMLWEYNDKGPNDVSRMDGNEVCTVSSNKRKDINRRGMCTEGTTCQCPRTAFKEYKNTAMLRGDNSAFATDKDAALASLIARRGKKIVRSTFLNLGRSLITGGSLAVAGAVIRAAKSPFGTARFAWGVVKWGVATTKFQCQTQLGCWPVQPKKTNIRRKVATKRRRVCRLPESAKDGGSPLYFLPPAGLMLRRRKWDIFGRCEMTRCEKPDRLIQRVGFGAHDGKEPFVYNCQPLNFEDMDTEQKAKFVSVVSKTANGEYDLSGLLKKYPL